MNKNELTALTVNDIVRCNDRGTQQGNMIVTGISSGAITCQIISALGTSSITLDYTVLHKIGRVAGT